MTDRRDALYLVAIALAFLAGLIVGPSARGATSPTAPEPSWLPVLPETPQPRGGGGASFSEPVVVQVDPSATVAVSPAPSVPVVTAVPSVVATGRPSPKPGGTWSRAVAGEASWFCSATSACTKGYPASGLYAAAGPALRVGAWRGRYVTVNGLRVRLIDFCGCPGGRVIDLYASVLKELQLPLSQGIYQVTVRW